MKNFFSTLWNKLKKIDKKWWLLLYIPVYAILFNTAEIVINSESDYFVSHLPIDDIIPFTPWFALFYFSWYAFFIGTGIFLLFKDSQTFKKYMWFVIISFTLSNVIFFIFPNGQNLRPSSDTLGNDIFSNMIKYLYTIDTNTNVLPSMHVLGCLAVVFSICKSKLFTDKKYIYLKVICSLWALMICLSTVFIKQHSVLDGLAAIAFSVPIYLMTFGNLLHKVQGPERKIYLFNKIMTIVMSITLICVMTFSIICKDNEEQRSQLLFTCAQLIGMIICLQVPQIISKTTKVKIPHIMEIIFVLFCFAHFILGEINGCFIKYSWWDDMLHTMSGVLLGIFGFVLINTLNNSEKTSVNLSPIFVCLFSVCFAMTIGVVWELIEYVIDDVTGTNMQRYFDDKGQITLVGHAALKDTMHDFVLDGIGSLFASVLGFIELKNQKYRITTMILSKVEKPLQEEVEVLKNNTINEKQE